jgi:hypothetical protein
VRAQNKKANESATERMLITNQALKTRLREVEAHPARFPKILIGQWEGGSLMI